mmetsp:Transcript_49645/g.118196  ORF Transcript_49645/g.118196 Transcript_49645/m.118196 type:complete len:209 (+) Transcript_49645:467-1093(+)
MAAIMASLSTERKGPATPRCSFIFGTTAMARASQAGGLGPKWAAIRCGHTMSTKLRQFLRRLDGRSRGMGRLMSPCDSRLRLGEVMDLPARMDAFPLRSPCDVRRTTIEDGERVTDAMHQGSRPVTTSESSSVERMRGVGATRRKGERERRRSKKRKEPQMQSGDARKTKPGGASRTLHLLCARRYNVFGWPLPTPMILFVQIWRVSR